MTVLQSVEKQLIEHLRRHLPAVQGQVYMAPRAQPQEGVPCSHAPSQAASGSVWLYGPSWRRNTWASCVPGMWQRHGNRSTRYHAPTAWDVLYDVLIMDRRIRSLNTVSTQLCICLAHACNLLVPETTPSSETDKTTSPQHHPLLPTSYELAWEDALLSRDMLGNAGWHTLSGRLKIEGLLLYSDTPAETGTVASKPLQLTGPAIKEKRPVS